MARTLFHTVARKDKAESSLARSLKLVTVFDDSIEIEWFQWFEKKAHEHDWPCNRWVGLVTIVLKYKALEAYDRMSVEDFGDHEEFNTMMMNAYKLRSGA